MGRARAPAMNWSLPPTPQPAAVAAFLRGVDRRARLLALVQTGDTRAAQGALAVATRVFAGDAEQWPIAQWPAQFWRLLLSVPAMGQRAAGGDRCDVLADIARLTPPLRAAVLLHLIAGLDDADAAAALGLGVGPYQQRIRSSLPRNPQGELDLVVWRGWRDAAQQALEQLPEAAEAVHSPARGALRPPRPAARTEAASSAGPAPRPRRRRWLWLLWLLLVLLVTLAAGLLLTPRGRAVLDIWRGRVHVEALPAAAAPKARFDPDDPAMDPDRDLHAAPRELALARSLPLLAWLAADADSRLPAGADAALPASPAGATPSSAAPAPSTSNRLRRDRGAWAEWQALTAAERSALRAVAARFDTLPAARRQALVAGYAAQSFDAHRGWHLGPSLGPDWPRIAALFAFVASDERQPLLILLRAATPEEMEALARLAQTTPPQGRATLRRQLLAQPSGRRLDWLQAQLNR